MWGAFESDPVKKFWRWFEKREADLFDFERDQDKVFESLAVEMSTINRHLTFEFGPKRDGTREFVISAGGIQDAFPSVVALANAAPKLKRWNITAFRPRRWPINTLEIGGHVITPTDVLFCLLDNGVLCGICLYIPDFREDDPNFKQIGYLLLDEALGEYDVETGVGLIKMFPRDTPTEHRLFPLPELPVMFDELQAKLQRKPRRPS